MSLNFAKTIVAMEIWDDWAVYFGEFPMGGCKIGDHLIRSRSNAGEASFESQDWAGVVRIDRNLEAAVNPETVPIENGVVEPVACLRSMDTLMSVVPDVPVDSTSRLLPTRNEGLKRFRIAFLTGLPLLIADVVSAFVSTVS